MVHVCCTVNYVSRCLFNEGLEINRKTSFLDRILCNRDVAGKEKRTDLQHLGILGVEGGDIVKGIIFLQNKARTRGATTPTTDTTW